jgi:hypothetical protein
VSKGEGEGHRNDEDERTRRTSCSHVQVRQADAQIQGVHEPYAQIGSLYHDPATSTSIGPDLPSSPSRCRQTRSLLIVAAFVFSLLLSVLTRHPDHFPFWLSPWKLPRTVLLAVELGPAGERTRAVLCSGAVSRRPAAAPRQFRTRLGALQSERYDEAAGERG